MGTRTITGLVGLLISVLVTFAPQDAGGLGLSDRVPSGLTALGINVSLPKRAVPAADMYLDFDPNARRLIVTRRGQVFLVAEARNDTVRPGQYGKWGHCPPGWYRLGPVVNTGRSVKFGPHFVGLFDTTGSTGAGTRHVGGMKRYGRAGIGIHGGGTGLKSPLAPSQGWLRTLGCVRMQNSRLETLVELLRWTEGGGGTCWIRVAPNRAVR
jgi:hypothetical protein